MHHFVVNKKKTNKGGITLRLRGGAAMFDVDMGLFGEVEDSDRESAVGVV
jgi:hypothetical protein